MTHKHKDTDTKTHRLKNIDTMIQTQWLRHKMGRHKMGRHKMGRQKDTNENAHTQRHTCTDTKIEA